MEHDPQSHRNEVTVKNFQCSEHGFVGPLITPKCPSCHTKRTTEERCDGECHHDFCEGKRPDTSEYTHGHGGESWREEFNREFYGGEKNSVYCRRHKFFATPIEIAAFIEKVESEAYQRGRQESYKMAVPADLAKLADVLAENRGYQRGVEEERARILAALPDDAEVRKWQEHLAPEADHAWFGSGAVRMRMKIRRAIATPNEEQSEK